MKEISEKAEVRIPPEFEQRLSLLEQELRDMKQELDRDMALLKQGLNQMQEDVAKLVISQAGAPKEEPEEPKTLAEEVERPEKPEEQELRKLEKRIDQRLSAMERDMKELCEGMARALAERSSLKVEEVRMKDGAVYITYKILT